MCFEHIQYPHTLHGDRDPCIAAYMELSLQTFHSEDLMYLTMIMIFLNTSCMKQVSLTPRSPHSHKT